MLTKLCSDQECYQDWGPDQEGRIEGCVSLILSNKKKQNKNKKLCRKPKSRTRWLHWGILPNIQRRILMIFLTLFQTIEVE